MLSDVIGDLLPSALAVALSPVPVIAIVLVLAGPRARAAGPAFALGWLAGLLVVAAVAALVVGTGADRDNDDPGLSWFKVAIGLLFLAMAANQWNKRPQPGQTPEPPRWMAGIQAATPSRALVLGAALSSANPKNLALTLSAAASIAEAGLGGGEKAIAVGVFVALASVTVAGPLLLHVFGGERSARPLDAIRRFMADNTAVILMVVLLLLGANLLGDGLAVI